MTLYYLRVKQVKQKKAKQKKQKKTRAIQYDSNWCITLHDQEVPAQRQVSQEKCFST